MSDTKTSNRPLNVDLLLAGDAAEFELLVTQESERLFRVIQRFIRDPDEARSVMQEAFLQAYERRHTFRKESKFTTWLYAIGINLARGALRKAARTSSFTDQELDALQPKFSSRGGPIAPVAPWNPERIAESNERMRIVRAAIDRLPDDYRIVVTLRDIEELSTPEAAEILQISEGAVRVRLHRARQALRTLLSDYFLE